MINSATEQGKAILSSIADAGEDAAEAPPPRSSGGEVEQVAGGLAWTEEQVDAPPAGVQTSGFCHPPNFANYVKDGVVDSAKSLTRERTRNAMVDKGNYVVEAAGKYYDIKLTPGLTLSKRRRRGELPPRLRRPRFIAMK